MMRHGELARGGSIPHIDIDQLLPEELEKATLENLILNAELEFIAEGNDHFDQDGNWRFRIDDAGDFVLEVRDAGAWSEQQKWTP